MTTLAEVNNKIHELKLEQEKLINQQRDMDDQKILSLDWTKDCFAKLEINSLVCAGLPRYHVHVYGAKGSVPYVFRPITVMGDHELYYYNVILSKQYGFDMYDASFSTYDKEMLLKFLNKVTFKTLDYDKDTFEVLSFVANKVKGV